MKIKSPGIWRHRESNRRWDLCKLSVPVPPEINKFTNKNIQNWIKYLLSAKLIDWYEVFGEKMHFFENKKLKSKGDCPGTGNVISDSIFESESV